MKRNSSPDSPGTPSGRDGTSTGNTPDEAFATAGFEATVAAAFPDERVTDVRSLGGESANLVAAVTLSGDRRSVLKCAPASGSESALAREAAVSNVVARETAVSVPQVVGADLDPAGEAMPYLVTEWAGGTKLQDALQSTPRPLQPQLFESLGETLATLHADTEFDAPGEIVATGTDAFEIDPADSWPEQFAHRLADHVERLDGTRFEGLAEEVWERVSERLQTLDTGDPPVLLHADLGDGNVTYDGTAVASILDWERAFVGHPEYDLCRAEVRYFWSQWGEADPLQSALYSGYRAVRDLPEGFEERRRCYLPTVYLLSLSTYEQWAPRLTDDLDSFAESLSEQVADLLDR
jgi:aminoglycoside phosphotransferase (APT) family kinase protein